MLPPVFPAFPLFAFLSSRLRTLLSSGFLYFPASCRVFPVRFPLVHVCFWSIFLSRAGTEKRLELTPVAAVSVHLLASDGAQLQVSRPITVSLPLPADGDLKENDAVPVWRFDPLLGTYRQKPLTPKLILKKSKGLCSYLSLEVQQENMQAAAHFSFFFFKKYALSLTFLCLQQ